MGQTQPFVSRRLPQSVIINPRHQKAQLNLLTITKCYSLNKCSRDTIQGDSSQRRFPVRTESPFLISLTFLQIGPKAVHLLCLPMLWSALYLQAILETVRSHQQSVKRLVRVGSLFCRQASMSLPGELKREMIQQLRECAGYAQYLSSVTSTHIRLFIPCKFRGSETLFLHP